MYSHCFTCNAPFPAGTLVEHFPVGSRIAYDPERGRLWAICEACSSWTLAPMEERWEAVVELERLATHTGPGRRRLQLAGTSENVSLFRGGGTDVIRVGRTTLMEEAAWRYCSPGPGGVRSGGANPFTPRRSSLNELMLRGAYMVRSAVPGGVVMPSWAETRRWVRFGSVAWAGDRKCQACDYPIGSLSFFECRTFILTEDGDDAQTPSLVRACPRCRSETDAGLHLKGTSAEFVLRRVLGYWQHGGVALSALRTATHLIDLGGGAPGLSRIFAKYARYLGELPHTSSIALRILAGDAVERRLLGMEAAALERRWKDEEELAAIIDRDLTDIPVLHGVRIKLRGTTQSSAGR